ncbi:ABC transporter substrate-binding protein [Pseudoduganella sp. UC29_106]|uniref:ABC transporter substrate-binding protein n=1 Tax=Pseudoduganella sp. UC29_106 TaxID=3374553 RepID=UPI00375783D0
MRSKFAIAAVLLVLLLGAAYVVSQRSPSKALPLEKLVIAVNTEYVGVCGVVAAQRQGYFADENLTVVVQPHSSGKSSMQAVLENRADLGTVADIPVMFAAVAGTPVRVVATLFRTEKDHGLVGRRDRGITGPASLKGKRVGVTQGTSAHFTLDVFLNWQRLSANDITIVNYKPEALPEALYKGEVDAVASWEPFLGEIRSHLGDNAVSFSGEDVYESIYNIVGMQQYVLAHPETVRRVLRALMSGNRYCRDNPEVMQPLLAATAKQTKEAVLAAWPSYHFEIELDQGLVLALEDRARWAIRNRMAASDQMPNFLEYIYLDGLSAVAPSSVTIIH